MSSKSFGHFLVEQGVINQHDHLEALKAQNKNRLLEDIALELNFLNEEEVRATREYMEKNPPVMFGEAAISLGLITFNQLRYLLDIRTRRKVRIGDILLDTGVITEEQLLKALHDFQGDSVKLQKIFLAAYSPITTGIITAMLEKYNYTLYTAKLGTAAFEQIKDVKPDIIIVGNRLNDMSGTAFCRMLISDPETASTNLIMLSTDNSEKSIQEAFEVGVNHFLSQPINEAELTNVICHIEKELVAPRKEKILVVDDSVGPRIIISKELAKAGYNVFQAKNGQEAIERAKDIKPDIITMDLEMPVLDGFEACRQLKDNGATADIPVIIISATYDPSLMERGFRMGAVEFFVKPFQEGKLADYVNTLVEAKRVKRREKILVVEDSKTTRHILKYLFSKNGYEVRAVEDAESALQVLPEFEPDLIITDCYMPGKSGFELTEEVKRSEGFHHLPVIMVTAAQKRDDVLKGLSVGASDYITKPFDESELLARTSTHILNKKLFDQVSSERDKMSRMFTYQSQLLNEISVLNEMGHQLQECHQEKETYPIIAETVKKLFPDNTGSLRMANDEEYQVALSWGTDPEAFSETMHLESCKALREESFCQFDDIPPSSSCRCRIIYPAGTFLCLPLKAHDKQVGLIHLHTPVDSKSRKQQEKGGAKREHWHLMHSTAEHISLAISNLRLKESLHDQSIRDPLTGLFNRRYMKQTLEREIDRAERQQTELSMIMLDVDHFKNLNDSYGHAVGDLILKDLGALLQKNIRQEDIACRYGGEEFLIIMPGATPKLAAERAELLRQGAMQINCPISDKEPATATISLGVASFPEDGDTGDQVISQADASLYLAKERGRNRVVSSRDQYV